MENKLQVTQPSGTTSLTVCKTREEVLSALTVCQDTPSQVAVVLGSYGKVRSLAESMSSKAPQLVTLRRELGDKPTAKIIAALLINLNQFLNLKHSLTEEHILYIVEELQGSEFLALTISDIMVVLNRAKRGDYGEMFERLAPGQIIQWFKRYIDDRLNAAEGHSIHEAKEAKEQKRDPLTEEELKSLYSGVGKPKEEPERSILDITMDENRKLKKTLYDERMASARMEAELLRLRRLVNEGPQQEGGEE